MIPAVKAVLYARVSSDEQADAGTIALQLDAIPRWAERHGIEIVDSYLDDGFTGTIMLYERPGGARLLKDAPELRARGVTTILLYNWRRLGREPWVVWGAVHQLEKVYGFRVKSISEEADTSTPERVMLLCIGTGQASMERAHTVKITREGSLLWAGRGAWMGGSPPYGYKVRREGTRAYLEPNEDPVPGIDQAFGITWAGVVRQMFAWSAEGLTHRAICLRLDAMSIPTSYRGLTALTPRSHRADGWYAGRIANMLRNPLYRGEYLYGRTRKRETASGAVPPLVTSEAWYAARETADRNMKRCKRNAKRDYILQGLLTCRLCGRALTGISSRARAEGLYVRYYRCGGARADVNPPGERCDAYANADVLERQVWETVERHARNPEEALQTIQQERSHGFQQVSTLLQRLEALRASAKNGDAERSRVIEWTRKGLITEADLQSQLAQITKEGEAVRTEITRLEGELHQAALTEAQVSSTRAILEDIFLNLGEDLEWDQKRELLLRALERIVVEVGGERYRRVLTVSLRYRGAGP